MALRAVFFDFGGTLGKLEPILDTPWKAWAKAAKDLGLRLSEDEIRRVNRKADQRFAGQLHSFHGRTPDFWRMRDMWAIDQLGVVSKRAEYFDALQRIFGDPGRVHLCRETLPVLKRIRSQGQHLGVVSNFTDGLLDLLKFHRLEPYFDSVTYSQAVGASKPDPRVFLHALERAGCDPGEAVHVGDSWEGDYLGALGAGMNAIWLNRAGRNAPQPCRQIRDLRGLIPLLASDL